MKKLTLFSIRSFAGPFVVTFFISMFMLIMQFCWKYIDDLIGKGLDVSVIMELMFYVSADLIPLALPLAILLSSIMTLGNLAENNELTALKSSGLSLFRIMRPLIAVVFFISVGTFYFANYVIPVANLKWHWLIFDIQETKVAVLLTPGSYSKELDGYAIKVEEGKDNTFKRVTIHDYTEPNVIKTIKADSATIYKSANGEHILFRLMNGKVIEEMQTQAPVFTNTGKPFRNSGSFRPNRRTSFSVATYKMDLIGFNLNRSDQDLFKDDFEMLNVFQIQEARDSMQRDVNKTLKSFTLARKNERPYFESLALLKMSQSNKNNSINISQAIPKKIIYLDSIPKNELAIAKKNAVVGLRQFNQNLDQERVFMESMENNNSKFTIEFHRKFALAASILVLFFVGAPLGAIVRKGGFGAPVVIAALLFMLYFVLFSIGENLANTHTVSPFWGMWMPSVALSPIAAILMISAINDVSVFDKKFWIIIITFGRKR